MKKILLISFTLLGVFVTNAQQSYPMEILPGKTVQLRSGADTLWVINNSQMNQTIITAMTLETSDSMFTIFQAEIKTLQKVIRRKNDIIKTNKDGLDHYEELWKTCDEDLEEQEKKVVKVKSRNKIWTGVGFVSGIIIAFMIQSIL